MPGKALLQKPRAFDCKLSRNAATADAAVIGEAAADRRHLPMRGGIVVGLAEVASARDDCAVAHDHRAERKIGLPRFVDGHTHNAA